MEPCDDHIGYCKKFTNKKNIGFIVEDVHFLLLSSWEPCTNFRINTFFCKKQSSFSLSFFISTKWLRCWQKCVQFFFPPLFFPFFFSNLTLQKYIHYLMYIMWLHLLNHTRTLNIVGVGGEQTNVSLNNAYRQVQFYCLAKLVADRCKDADQ